MNEHTIRIAFEEECFRQCICTYCTHPTCEGACTFCISQGHPSPCVKCPEYIDDKTLTINDREGGNT